MYEILNCIPIIFIFILFYIKILENISAIIIPHTMFVFDFTQNFQNYIYTII